MKLKILKSPLEYNTDLILMMNLLPYNTVEDMDNYIVVEFEAVPFKTNSLISVLLAFYGEIVEEVKKPSMLEKLQAHIDNPDNEEFYKNLKEEYQKKDEFNDRWVEKVRNCILSKTDNELYSLFNKFQAHDRKIVDILWDRNIDGESDLKWYILQAFSKIGKECRPKKWGMFTTAMYKYKGFYCEQISGQGTFIKLYV